MPERNDKTATNLSKRGIVQGQDTGEETHPKGSPVPGAFGPGEHKDDPENQELNGRTANRDKALAPES